MPVTDQFASTETHYAAHRPGYGAAAIAHVRERFGLGAGSRVLDLGCGTGQVGLALAPHVGHVVGMDPNPEMVRAARRAATAQGSTAATDWVVAGDDQLRGAMGPFDCVTVGRALHWMDRERTARRVSEATVDGGGLAILEDVEWVTHGEEDWHAAVYDVASEFVPDLPDRVPQSAVEYDEPYAELLARCGYEDVRERAFTIRREWDADAVVGYLLSLSFCSPATLGADRDDFVAAVRACVEPREPLAETTTVTVTSGRS